MLFGDHVLVEFNVVYHKTDREIVKCRDWRKYSKESIFAKLSTIDWNIDIDNVQEFWNSFEKKLINEVDEIVPLTAFNGGVVKTNIPKNIKNKINKRNRLLKSFKKSPTLGLKSRIADLNCEIRSHFFYRKKFEVRKGILPGNSKSLWKAVKIAKNVSPASIPINMKINNTDSMAHPITGHVQSEM